MLDENPNNRISLEELYKLPIFKTNNLNYNYLNIELNLNLLKLVFNCLLKNESFIPLLPFKTNNGNCNKNTHYSNIFIPYINYSYYSSYYYNKNNIEISSIFDITNINNNINLLNNDINSTNNELNKDYIKLIIENILNFKNNKNINLFELIHNSININNFDINYNINLIDLQKLRTFMLLIYVMNRQLMIKSIAELNAISNINELNII